MIARLLRQHGVDPGLIPDRYEVVQATVRGVQGIYVTTYVVDEHGDLLVDDLTGDEVTYHRFYPEPEDGPSPDVRGDCA